jgi:hypothetical protein
MHSPVGSTPVSNILKAGEGYKGVLKSIPGTAAGIAGFIPGASGVSNSLNKLAQPSSPEQAYGKNVGNAAQFLIPGAGEEKLGLYGASKLPMLGRYAAPVAKLGAQALGTGAVNAAQGGSFGTGAAAGAAGGLFGMGLQKVAPMLAETAMGVRATDRAYGRTPGQAIMAETTGTNPGSIAQQAATKSAGYTDTLNDNALRSNVPVDLQSPRNIAASFLDTATKRNNPSTIKEIGAIGSQLASRPGAGAIPQMVSADEGLALRRGIDDLQGSWNPNLTRSLSDTAVNGTRQEMATQLENAIPDYRSLNSKISTLIPVAQRAGAADLNAGVMQRVIGRAAKPTGALLGAATGGGIGYREGGGLQGAALGAGLGLFAPELLTSPKTLMMGARGMASPVTQKALLPFATGAALQAAPKKGLYQ